MPDLGILGWIIIGLVAGAIAGFFVPGRERMGCIGTLLVGVAGGLIGGFLWENVLNMGEASGWLGALVIAVLGSILVLFVLRAMSRDNCVPSDASSPGEANGQIAGARSPKRSSGATQGLPATEIGSSLAGTSTR